MERVISFFGLLTMLGLAWLLSDDRSKVSLRLVLSGVLLQLAMAFVLLRSALGEKAFVWANATISGIIACSDEGARFVFGDTFRDHFFAFSVMPTVIFFSSLAAVLFHLGVLQWVVKIMARVMVWVMDVSGTESLATSANVLVGMTTAPLMIRPYLKSMTRSELMAMMTGGMATVSGGTMAAYVGMAKEAGHSADQLPGHLMVASLISAPAALVVAKIMVPETEDSPTKGTVKVDVPKQDANLLDAACRGAGEGLKLALNIVAMLIAFIALIHAINLGLSLLPPVAGEPVTLERMFGLAGAPLAWVMGVPWKDAHAVGIVLAERTVFNEFIGYQSLMEGQAALQPRSFTIAAYALCGFANFGSIAVMIGGIGGLVPERRKDLAKYGLRSLVGGSLAAFMTAAVAGMLI